MTSNRKGKCLGVNRIYATGASGGTIFVHSLYIQIIIIV